MFDECMSITRRNDGQGEWHRIKYAIFDAPNARGGILTRLEEAKSSIDSRLAHIYVHKHEICKSTEYLLEELAKIEQVDGEGFFFLLFYLL
jgi:hypothetical protein